MAPQQLRRLFLTGFSNSAVAELVAKALGWRALDSDRLVEEAAGRAVAEIFAQDGEPRFRELERLRRWMIGTRDAHELYNQFGFIPLEEPERWMELSDPDAYGRTAAV